MDVAKTLNGKTPAQHCAEMIKKYKGGYFETKDEGLDVCNLPTPSLFGGTTMGPEYNYHYAVCEEIEFTAKLNDKPTTAKELANLKGGERVIISANQEVTWVVPNAAKLEKPPKTGTPLPSPCRNQVDLPSRQPADATRKRAKRLWCRQ